jgi:hypothetical protein
MMGDDKGRSKPPRHSMDNNARLPRCNAKQVVCGQIVTTLCNIHYEDLPGAYFLFS